MTANNAELYAWPIDLEQSRITLSAGELVTVNIADYKITDPKLVPGEWRCCMIQLRREWGRFSNFSFRTPQRRISAYPARPSG